MNSFIIPAYNEDRGAPAGRHSQRKYRLCAPVVLVWAIQKASSGYRATVFDGDE